MDRPRSFLDSVGVAPMLPEHWPAVEAIFIERRSANVGS